MGLFYTSESIKIDINNLRTISSFANVRLNQLYLLIGRIEGYYSKDYKKTEERLQKSNNSALFKSKDISVELERQGIKTIGDFRKLKLKNRKKYDKYIAQEEKNTI